MAKGQDELGKVEHNVHHGHNGGIGTTAEESGHKP
jgi:hypothetical protein